MSATVIVKNDRCTGEYDMFDVRSVDLEGEFQSAVLCGPLFLEVGETMTLRVASGNDKIELVARVQAVTAADSLMTVRLVDLDSRSRTLLANLKLDANASAADSGTTAKSASASKK
jgi:hypothetical protein